MRRLQSATGAPKSLDMTNTTSATPWLLALALAAPLAAAAAPPPNVQREVDYLLGYIEKSGCSFYRNGSWSDSGAAAGHVRMKYDYLSGRDQIASTADFIDKTASESSVTGIPYQVRCDVSPPMLSRTWLGDELARYRAQSRR